MKQFLSFGTKLCIQNYHAGIFAVGLIRLQRYSVWSLLPTSNKITWSNKKITSEIVNGKGIVFHHDSAKASSHLTADGKLMARKWSHIFHAALIQQHLKTICLQICIILHILKQMTMTFTPPCFNNLLKSTRNFMSTESSDWKKDGRKSLSKMKNI